MRVGNRLSFGMKIFFFRTKGGFFSSIQELRQVGGELGAVLEERVLEERLHRSTLASAESRC
jgi:hypothetical protein